MNYISEAVKTESLQFHNVNPRLLHAWIGIQTEIIELFAAIESDDTVNIQEEIGDLYWYSALACDELQITFEEAMLLGQKDWDEMGALMIALVDPLDHLKKCIFYGKELDLVRVSQGVGNLLFFLEHACRSAGVTPVEMQARNLEKLHRRYGEKFSSEAAENRNIDHEMAAFSGSQA